MVAFTKLIDKYSAMVLNRVKQIGFDVNKAQESNSIYLIVLVFFAIFTSWLLMDAKYFSKPLASVYLFAILIYWLICFFIWIYILSIRKYNDTPPFVILRTLFLFPGMLFFFFSPLSNYTAAFVFYILMGIGCWAAIDFLDYTIVKRCIKRGENIPVPTPRIIENVKQAVKKVSRVSKKA